MKTKIDYLRFRFKKSPFEVLESLRSVFGFLDPDLLQLGGSEKGKDGWQLRRPVVLAGDQVIAWIDYGGDSQRGWSRWDMSGEGCSWVSDWRAAADCLNGMGAELRRVDIALDFFEGEVGHDSVLAAYEAGAFCRGGRPPKMRKVEGSCPTDGRTIYIGSRESSRFIRCYEKGWEVLSKARVPECFKSGIENVYFRRGVPSHPRDYYRLEVELKAVDRLFLPLDVLVNPDSYFSGAAPYFADLVFVAPSRPLEPPTDVQQVQTVSSSMDHCSRAYGGLFRALVELYGDDQATKAKLFDALCSDRPSDRLVKSGCLSLPVLGAGAGGGPLGGCPAPGTIHKELQNDLN